jgi:hypothetical protein
MEAHSHLCIPDCTQMVISHFIVVALSIVVGNCVYVWNVITIIRVYFYIYMEDFYSCLYVAFIWVQFIGHTQTEKFYPVEMFCKR